MNIKKGFFNSNDYSMSRTLSSIKTTPIISNFNDYKSFSPLQKCCFNCTPNSIAYDRLILSDDYLIDLLNNSFKFDLKFKLPIDCKNEDLYENDSFIQAIEAKTEELLPESIDKIAYDNYFHMVSIEAKRIFRMTRINSTKNKLYR
jgi:hypothetical protein